MINLSEINQWLMEWRYFALFPLTVIEGPIITIIAGFLTSLKVFNFFIAYAVVVAGDLVGDVIHYYVGRIGGKSFVSRWGKYIGLDERNMGIMEKQFAERGRNLLFLGKMSHGIGGAFLIAAGVAKMPFDKFIAANSLASIIKSLLLLAIGYYFGYAITEISGYMEKIALVTIGTTFLVLLAWWMYFKKNSKN